MDDAEQVDDAPETGTAFQSGGSRFFFDRFAYSLWGEEVDTYLIQHFEVRSLYYRCLGRHRQ